MTTQTKSKKKKKAPGAFAHGRPTKLTKEVTEKFTDAISIGSGYTLSAQYAGVSVEVTAHWMREARRELARREAGEKQNPKAEPYLGFLRAVRDAEAEAGVTYQKVLDRAAKTDPQWAYKMQRARFPLDYIELNTSEEVEIPADMDIEHLDRILAGESPVVVVRDWKQFQKEQAAAIATDANDKK